MAAILANNWRTLAARGAVSIIIGLIAFFMPLVTLYALTMLFGAYVLIDGIASLTTAIRSSRHGEHWWELLLVGIVGIAAAIFTFIRPTITLVFLVYLIALWAIVTGGLQVAAAIRLRRHIKGEWLLILSGVASLIFGVLLFIAPLAGAVVLAWWVGAFIFLMGILMLALAFRLRNWTGSLKPQLA